MKKTDQLEVDIKNKNKLMYDIKRVKRYFEEVGYKWFTKGDYNLNIVGIRNTAVGDDVTNSFDDHLILNFNEGGNEKTFIYPITTDPGKHWMNHPLNTNGTAILVPGQYRSSYIIRKHQNKYDAVCQAKPVRVYRDNDKDDEYDFNPTTIQEGIFGINIHRSNPYTESYYIDKWSAGCQVFKKVEDFNEFMDYCYKARSIWGNSFTYTLIESDKI